MMLLSHDAYHGSLALDQFILHLHDILLLANEIWSTFVCVCISYTGNLCFAHYMIILAGRGAAARRACETAHLNACCWFRKRKTITAYQLSFLLAYSATWFACRNFYLTAKCFAVFTLPILKNWRQCKQRWGNSLAETTSLLPIFF